MALAARLLLLGERSRPNRSGTWNVSLIVGCPAVLRSGSAPGCGKKLTRLCQAPAKVRPKPSEIFIAPYQILLFIDARCNLKIRVPGPAFFVMRFPQIESGLSILPGVIFRSL
jgi:hypothetical protein